MTEQERYIFDLQGFLVVANALSSEEVDKLNAIMDEHIDRECDADMSTHRFTNLLRWGKAYRNLIDNPAIVTYMEELVDPRFRLDHDYADIIRSGKGPIGTRLHGGATPFSPLNSFNYHNGRFNNGLTVVAYNLKDVNPSDGGFGCVPGSHKSNLPFPDEWKEMDENLELFVRKVTGEAGTAIIFTEALTHGTLPWYGKGERRTLFYKYSPPSISWSAHYYDANDFDDLSERQRALLEPPNSRYPNRMKSLEKHI